MRRKRRNFDRNAFIDGMAVGMFLMALAFLIRELV